MNRNETNIFCWCAVCGLLFLKKGLVSFFLRFLIQWSLLTPSAITPLSWRFLSSISIFLHTISTRSWYSLFSYVWWIPPQSFRINFINDISTFILIYVFRITSINVTVQVSHFHSRSSLFHFSFHQLKILFVYSIKLILRNCQLPGF